MEQTEQLSQEEKDAQREMSEALLMAQELEPVTEQEREQAEQAEAEQAQIAERQANSIETRAMVASVLGPTLSIIAPNWEIERGEVEALSEVYADVLDKYFPDGLMGRFSVEISALAVTAMIIQPRLGKPMKEVEKKPEKEVSSSDNKAD